MRADLDPKPDQVTVTVNTTQMIVTEHAGDDDFRGVWRGFAHLHKTFRDAMPKPGRQSIMQAVRRSVYLMLPMGRANLEQVASGLGMNEHTLPRELDKAGVSFSFILTAGGPCC